MYAEMVFGYEWTPLKDVWFPLDLSNAASFNATLAHSAAHLGRMYGSRDTSHGFKYKAEAIRIINIWITDKSRALSDDIFAAVIRLLSYEVRGS